MSVLLILSNDEPTKWLGTLFSVAQDSRRFLKILSDFKNLRGNGVESISIFFQSDFEEWDEYRCHQDEVALILNLSSVEEIGYLSFANFYPLIVIACSKYINKYPQDRIETELLLQEIKTVFNL